MQGVNFLKISEGLASLNVQEFYQRIRVFSHLNFVADNHNFYNNEMFSFPSNDQVISIFLDSFNKHNELYEAKRKSLSAKSISCDHRFKVSRKIGLVRRVMMHLFHNLSSYSYYLMNLDKFCAGD